ncbi:DUF2946 family protein [Stutzerimonas nitrititolerans]|uniref:DUF2946 family protein n=1 Tax=Stutzerimonas nitrititolerans TaxID=2482751 RepID=UPI00289CC785|nr:DUF2946 family protein [Stutzerimonas nitrititolerans]
MKTAMAHRTTLIRILLLCILFSLYACGLHHGQMHGSGDEPTQLSEANLSHHHHGHADSEPPATPHHSFTPAFTCPLCSSYAPAVAINSLDWSMAFIAHAPPPAPASLDRVPALPRHLRPAINPRASPEAIRNS